MPLINIDWKAEPNQRSIDIKVTPQVFLVLRNYPLSLLVVWYCTGAGSSKPAEHNNAVFISASVPT